MEETNLIINESSQQLTPHLFAITSQFKTEGAGLKAIVDGIGEGISIIDDDLKIVWVNSIIEQWAGPLDEIKGKNCYKAYQKRDTPYENCPTLKTFKTGEIEKAGQFAYDNQGNLKYFEFTSSLLKDGWGRNIKGDSQDR